MPTNCKESEYTKAILSEYEQYRDSAEYSIVRELCAVYDYLCNCPATADARMYIRQRIEAHTWNMRQIE